MKQKIIGPVSVSETAQGHGKQESKYRNNIIQLKLPWYFDPSDPIILPIEDRISISTNSIKKLPLTFPGRGEVKGRQFTQLKSSILAYLYQVQLKGVTYYEVFRRRQNMRFGNEIYPSSNAFGKYAWTFLSLNKAIEIFDRINKEGGLK